MRHFPLESRFVPLASDTGAAARIFPRAPDPRMSSRREYPSGDMQTPAPEPQPLARLRDSLLRLYAEARDLGEHQVAYHALAGALHAAESLRQPDVLDQVAALARSRKRIDQDDPRHPLSSQSASIRGHHSIFEHLAATCAAVRARLKAEDLTRK